MTDFTLVKEERCAWMSFADQGYALVGQSVQRKDWVTPSAQLPLHSRLSR